MTEAANKPEIIVIGAGASGISAATKLIDNGFDNIKILEAENRIGGRIYSTDFKGIQVDLGAQWCHGEEGNIVYQKVKELDVIGQPASADYLTFNFLTSDGIEIDKNVTDQLVLLCWESINDLESQEGYDGCFKEYFLKCFNQHCKDLLSKDDKQKMLNKMVLDFFHKLMLVYEAAESWDTFAVNKAFKKCEGQWLLHWKNNGFRTIIDVMMGDIPEAKSNFLRNNILLDKIVNQVTWEDNQKIKIDCTDGSSYKADHVIITVSVAVLKEFVRNNTFVPTLPSEKIALIQAIPLGTTNKIYLKFATKWWPDSIKDFSFLWQEKDKKSLLEEFPDGPKLDGRSWLEDICGFYTVDNHPNLLLGWVVGKMAKEIELISDEITIKGCMFLIRKFAGKKLRIPNPEGVLRSKWGTNPHFLGSYSYTSIEMVTKQMKNGQLAKPLCHNQKRPVLLFAGEATHSQYMSTVHGAIETGYREADRIINLYS